MTERIRVDVNELTLGEMAEAQEQLNGSDGPGSQFRYTAAMAWVIRRRSDPTYTYEQALGLRMADIELVQPDGDGDGTEGKAGEPPPGITPPSSPEPGTSTLVR